MGVGLIELQEGPKLADHVAQSAERGRWFLGISYEGSGERDFYWV